MAKDTCDIAVSWGQTEVHRMLTMKRMMADALRMLSRLSNPYARRALVMAMPIIDTNRRPFLPTR